jgi:hypothetical protein
LGAVDSPVADFLNLIEQPWFDKPGYGTKVKQWDQLAMMAALEKESIAKSRSVHVRMKENVQDITFLFI